MLKALIVAGQCGYHILDYWTDERRGHNDFLSAWDYLFHMGHSKCPSLLGIPDPRTFFSPEEPTQESLGFYVWEGTYEYVEYCPTWRPGCYRRASPDEVEAFSLGRRMGDQEDRITTILPSTR